ncbi:hypothetical protein [Brucella rhizosphaerae]|uniref:hypothetical protein n=1 Tax=Brucella rhizosphaerae TaxID=571254 RepID=UPI000465B100|nr:hypothetical protein [Brucella rhizosphaerae]
MSKQRDKALSAARSLAKTLALPSGRGSVFVWHGDNGDRIVVAVDRTWLNANRILPATFQGFPVEVEDKLGVVSHTHRAIIHH